MTLVLLMHNGTPPTPPITVAGSRGTVSRARTGNAQRPITGTAERKR